MIKKSENSVSKYKYFNLKFRIVWTTKYKRKLLETDVELRLREIVNEVVNELKISIEKIDISLNKVELIIVSIPNYSPHILVQKLKRKLSHELMSEFSKIKSRTPSLWNKKYYIESLGKIDNNASDLFVDNQKYV